MFVIRYKDLNNLNINIPQEYKDRLKNGSITIIGECIQCENTQSIIKRLSVYSYDELSYNKLETQFIKVEPFIRH